MTETMNDPYGKQTENIKVSNEKHEISMAELQNKVDEINARKDKKARETQPIENQL